MTPDQVVTIIVGVAQSGAAGLIVWALLRSLKIRIDGLQKTISVQNETIIAMEKRVGEAEKIGDLYKGLVRDLPTLLESLSKGKDQIIRDLQSSLEHKEKASASMPSGAQKKEDRAILLTMRFMLSGDHGELTKIAHGVAGNIDSAAVLLSRAKDFDDFVRSAGGKIQFEDDKDRFKERTQFQDSSGKPTGVRSTSASVGGFYAIFGDRTVLMSTSKYQDLRALVEELRMELDTLT
jgi:hypothetical protein